MPPSHKFRILFLAANPIDTDELRLGEELRDIKAALRQAEYRDRFEVYDVWAARVKDMRRAMLQYDPHVLHFAGHGGDGSVYVEDKDGKAYPVHGDALSNFLINFPSVQCVVLNACYSDELGKALTRTVPYVIGMQASIRDTAAISFAVAFYDALGAGRQYDSAFNIAANALELEANTLNTPILACKGAFRNGAYSNRPAVNTRTQSSATYAHSRPPSSQDVAQSSRSAHTSPDHLPDKVWRFSTPVQPVASVYGIVPGRTRFLSVNEILGEPTRRRRYDGKLEAHYDDYGLCITYAGDSSKNDHIQYMDLDADKAGELPYGLYQEMARFEWEALLSSIYGPALEREPGSVVTFEPSPEVVGNKIVVMLRGERIDRIRIYSCRTS